MLEGWGRRIREVLPLSHGSPGGAHIGRGVIHGYRSLEAKR